MQPSDRRNTGPIVPQRQVLPSASGTPRRAGDTNVNDSAANVVRHQLNAIYNGQTATPTPQTTPVAAPQTSNAATVQQQSIEAADPYERTHSTNETVNADSWKQYHSAWQDYYQKYYERYYIGQVYRARQVLEEKAREAAANRPAQPVQPAAQPAPAQEPTPTPAPAPTPASVATSVEQAEETFSRDEAMYDLRAKLLGKVGEQAKKVRKSRHFIPIISAVAVMLIFVFLQYNTLIFANVYAYVSPGNIDPANIIVDPSSTVAVSNDPRLIIPKINVDVPVNWNTTPDYNSQMAGMANGVAYFGIPGADSKPGQIGNTVLSGHSSNQWTDPGKYKFIFVRLDDLQKGDTIYINYQGTRYTYTVTKKEVVAPTDVQALIYPTTKPMLTLITCTPIGTAQSRLLVTAQQVSPSPDGAQAAPQDNGSSSDSSIKMPGNSPTVFEQIFGGGN